MLLDVDEVVSLHEDRLPRWEAQGRPKAGPEMARPKAGPETVRPTAGPHGARPAATLLDLVEAQHFANFAIWGLEDEARREGPGTDAPVAAAKRAIDGWNQRRNDLVEAIDDAVLEHFSNVDASAAPLHSETAGMMIDRLSILALKLRAMKGVGDAAAAGGDGATADECSRRGAVLRAQRGDLAGCLAVLLDDIQAGRRHFRRYRQLKAYNDPRLNPVLRAAAARDGDSR